MSALLTNNAVAVLNAGITISATSVTLNSGQGALFPNPGVGEYFYATLVDASYNVEIVKCTARSTDTLTIVRAQDGTTARAYIAGDRLELRPIAEHFREKADKGANTDITSLTGITGAISSADSVQYDTTATGVTVTPGLTTWNDGEGTLDLGLKGGNVTLAIGNEEYARVYNDQGSTITKGQVVYISGAQGNRIAVKLARADVEATSFGTLGIVAESITNGSEGWIIVSGALGKLNTTGFTAGGTIYLSPTTAGAYTQTKPQAPDQLVVLGWAERIDSTVGSIYIKIDNGYELDELHDVRITSPTSGNTLIYDASTSPTGVWKNANLTAGTGIGITNGAGSITIANSGVTSITGTASQVTASASTGSVTLSLPSTINVNTSGNAATATTATNQSGGTVSATTGSFSGVTSITNTTASTLSTNGALVVSGGVGIGGRTTVNDIINRITGNGNAAWLQQDGTGRNHWYWNTYGGTTPVFTNSGEDASSISLHITGSGSGGTFFHRSASGVGKVAGDPITWTTTIYSDITNFTYKGVEVVRTSDAQTLTNKTINLGSNTLVATSAQLAAAVTDETGTGSLVFSASPTFTGTANFANISASGSLTVTGDLTINGTTTTINSTTISVDDKNIELGSVATPSDTTADGGGITLKGATDKTFNWVNANSAWTSSEHIRLAAGKDLILAGATSGTVTLEATATAGTTTIVFPATSGTVITSGDTSTVTNTMLAGSIANNKLTNSSITINGTSTSLGGTISVGTVTSVAVSVPTGFSISGSPITSSGTIGITFSAGYSLPTTSSQSNWDTAFGWGNHASAGYALNSNIGVTIQGYDADLAAIAALAGTSGFLKKTAANTWSLDTNTYLTSYTETDPIYVASSWYTTTNNSSNWNTAFGWGNHASAGYLTSATAATTYQPLDADLTAIAGLTPTADNFIVGNGTTWTQETPAQARTSLGATTVGSNLFTLTNPSAVTFPRFNADNTISALDAATFRTAIGAGTSSTTGTVTTVSVVSSNGFTGTVTNDTTTPAITLTTSVTGVLKGNGTSISAATAGSDYGAPGTASTWTASQRGTVTDNTASLSFNMSTTNNFKTTPTATGALTFTNLVAGQSGYVLLINTGGHAITAAATTKVGTSFLTTVSTAGTYLVSYFTDGTNVYCTASGALA